MNIVNFLFKNFENKNVAILSGQRRITYDVLCNNVIDFSKLIQTDGEVVVIYMANSIEYVISYFAVLLAGKKAFLINPMYPDTEVKKYMDLVNCDLLISNSESETLKTYYRIIYPIIKDIRGHDLPAIPDRNEEGAIIIPTSGTTGEAKLIMLTHENIGTNVHDITESYNELVETDVEMIILPLTSIFANTAQMLVPFNKGMILDIWTGGFNMPSIMKDMKEKNVSYCQMVPAILRMFVFYYEKLGIKMPSFKRTTIGGEPISVNELKRLAGIISPIKIMQGYGMTETSPVISSQNHNQPIKFGSVGYLMKSVQVKIMPMEKDRKEGIIFVKGPSVCKQTYDGKPLVDENGWLNTGDIGFLDDDRELYICGRQKNLIVVGGMNVYPEEVEGVMKAFPGVRDAYIFGERNGLKGEVVRAKITVLHGVDIFQLKKYCSEHLPIYKIPESIEIVEELDKTYSSKIKRF